MTWKYLSVIESQRKEIRLRFTKFPNMQQLSIYKLFGKLWMAFEYIEERNKNKEIIIDS